MLSSLHGVTGAAGHWAAVASVGQQEMQAQLAASQLIPPTQRPALHRLHMRKSYRAGGGQPPASAGRLQTTKTLRSGVAMVQQVKHRQGYRQPKENNGGCRHPLARANRQRGRGKNAHTEEMRQVQLAQQRAVSLLGYSMCKWHAEGRERRVVQGQAAFAVSPAAS